MPQTESLRSAEEMAPEAWRALARARIYFGHQSVGANVMQGVEELLAANPAIPLVVEPYAGAGPVTPGAIAHGGVGRNLDYISKIDAFAELIDGELAGRVDIAFFKFCYVDITPDTDVGQVFRRYTETLAELAARHPEITFMHSTAPLTLRLGPSAAVVRR